MRHTRFRFLQFFWLLFLCVFILHPIVSAQRSIRPDFEILDAYVQKEMSACRIPGFALAVLQKGQVLYMRGYGKADPTGRVVTPDTPFHIASLSKSFTALAIMQLVELGRVDLDERVRVYLQWFTLKDADRADTITIRQLLNHTSGLVEDAEFSVATLRGDDTSIVQLVERLKDGRTSGAPGKIFQYNNANYIILGAVIEAVSGLSYQDYIQQYIFDPLGMHHSYLSLDPAIEEGLATGYRTVFGFPMPVQLPFRTDFLPAYSIISSIADLSVYVSMLQNEGEHQKTRIISAGSLKKMFAVSSSVSPWEWYGLGWFLTSGSIHHGGELTNYQSKIKILTEDDIAVIMLYNTSSSTLGTLFNVGYRDRIEGGVFNILYGFAPDYYPRGSGILDLNRYPVQVSYTLFLALSVLIVYRLTAEVFGLAQYHRSLSQRKRRLQKSLVTLLLWNFTLPIGLLVLVPALTRASWAFIIYYIPDVGVLAMSSCVVLLGLGAFKLVVFTRHARKIWGLVG